MAKDPRGESGGARSALGIIVHSGDVERVHYALALASSAAAVNMHAILFFTMGGIRTLLRDRMGLPGWHALGSGESGLSPDARESALRERGVATFEDLLNACVELGVMFMVCEMGLRVTGLSRDDLRADIPYVEGGIVTMLRQTEDGKIIFV